MTGHYERAGLWIYSEDTFGTRNSATESEAMVFIVFSGEVPFPQLNS